MKKEQEFTEADQKIHDEMLFKLKDLVDFLNANKFGYWLTVGRKGQAANYCGGSRGDVTGAVISLTQRNEEIASLLQKALIESLE